MGVIRIIGAFMGFFLIHAASLAQEEPINVEESAEVFLEEYSDDFQEHFFEALKQKGIENYDRAINLLLECKLIDADNSVVDFELAKVYLLDKQFIPAQEHAISALLSNPENHWYLNTLVTIMQMQGGSMNQIKGNIPFDNLKLKENLALIYYRQKNYHAALEVIKQIRKSTFTKELSSKINDSIKSNEKKNKNMEVQFDDGKAKENPIEALKQQMENFIRIDAIEELKTLNNETLENYPSQPFFYYVQGYTLNKSAQYEGAIAAFETALDYLFDDVSLQNRIYRGLVNAYTALNNPSKANTYLRMIKAGF